MGGGFGCFLYTTKRRDVVYESGWVSDFKGV